MAKIRKIEGRTKDFILFYDVTGELRKFYYLNVTFPTVARLHYKLHRDNENEHGTLDRIDYPETGSGGHTRDDSPGDRTERKDRPRGRQRRDDPLRGGDDTVRALPFGSGMHHHGSYRRGGMLRGGD